MPGLQFASSIDKGYDNDLKRMSKNTKKFTTGIEKQTSTLNKTFLNLGKTVSGVLGVMAFARAGKELLTFSQDVETALTEVGTISQAVTEDFEGYKKAIIDLSKKGGQGAKKLTEAFYDIVSAGNDGAKGLEILRVAQEAGTAGYVEVATAADGLTTVLNAWNKTADEAVSVSDIFFKTVEKGKTTFPELGSNIAQVAPLAASLGVSFEEVSGAVATITKQGVPTAQAFTQIRSALVGMTETLGDGWAETMTLQEGMQAISDKAKGSATEIQKLVGRVEGMSAILSITGNNAATAAEDLDAMRNSLGATATAAEKVLKSSEQQIGILKNNILASFQGMSDGVLKSAVRAAEGINRMFSRQAIKNIEDQRIEVNSLIIKLKDVNLEEGVREGLLNRLNTLAPDVKKALEDESGSIDLLSKSLDVYNKQMALKILIAEQDIKLSKQRGRVQDFTEMQAEREADLLKAINSSSEFLRKELPKEEKEIDAILFDTTKDITEKAEILFQKTVETGTGIRTNYILSRAITNFKTFKDLYAFESKGLEEMIKDADKLVDDYSKILNVSKGDIEEDGKSGKSADQLEKERLARLERERKEREKKEEAARKKALKNIEIENKKTILTLNQHYADFEGNEKAFNDRLLNQQLIYLDKKHKLTIDALERLAIEQEILQTRIERDGRISKIKFTFEEESDFPELRESTSKFKDSGVSKDEESIISSFEDISTALSSTGNDITNQLADLSSSTVSAFETLNTESSTTSDKISGIVSLIKIAGELIKDIVTNAYTKEADALSDANNEIAKRIQSEEIINRLVRERAEIELNSSAFLDANYKDTYALALQTLNDSKRIIDESLSALSGNLILTATGKGESWLGINETAEEYSFTLDQIINKSDTLSGINTGGTISNILDPADIFGGAASAEAYEDALNKVEKAFNSTLEAMGKTASDMANFSSEEWIDFYKILDEGGFIADQGTKNLVDGMREAQEQYQQALEEMKGVIQNIAGSLGNALGDSLVDSIQNGTDALDNFKKSLNDVFIEMAKAQVNSLFFQSLFDTLQEEMRLSMEGGDQDWQDDLLRFYDKLPTAIQGAEAFLNDFDQGLQDLGFEGLTGDEGGAQDLSTAGQISQAITEETGTILAGHIGAMRLSNERIANYSEDLFEQGVTNLVYLDKIVKNTDYLPEIAANTKKTADRLG